MNQPSVNLVNFISPMPHCPNADGSSASHRPWQSYWNSIKMHHPEKTREVMLFAGSVQGHIAEGGKERVQGHIAEGGKELFQSARPAGLSSTQDQMARGNIEIPCVDSFRRFRAYFCHRRYICQSCKPDKHPGGIPMSSAVDRVRANLKNKHIIQNGKRNAWSD